MPQYRIVATFDGTWRGRIRWRRVGTDTGPGRVGRSTTSSPSPSYAPSMSTELFVSSQAPGSYSTSRLSRISDGSGEDEWRTLLDLSMLQVIPKVVRPLEKQEPRESRKLWENVTNNLLKKEYSEATKEKIVIEQRQRDEAAERKRKGVQYVLFFFPPMFFFSDRWFTETYPFFQIGLFQDILFKTMKMDMHH